LGRRETTSPVGDETAKKPAEGKKKTSRAKRKIDETSKFKRSRTKKPRDMPKRPLSAYNLFFRDERARILNERVAAAEGPKEPSQDIEEVEDDTDERPYTESGRRRRKPGLFESMAKTIAKRWKDLSPEELEKYNKQASEEMFRYREELDGYRRDVEQKAKTAAEEKMQEQSRIQEEAKAEICVDVDSLYSLREPMIEGGLAQQQESQWLQQQVAQLPTQQLSPQIIPQQQLVVESSTLGRAVPPLGHLLQQQSLQVPQPVGQMLGISGRRGLVGSDTVLGVNSFLTESQIARNALLIQRAQEAQLDASLRREYYLSALRGAEHRLLEHQQGLSVDSPTLQFRGVGSLTGSSGYPSGLFVIPNPNQALLSQSALSNQLTSQHQSSLLNPQPSMTVTTPLLDQFLRQQQSERDRASSPTSLDGSDGGPDEAA